MKKLALIAAMLIATGAHAMTDNMALLLCAASTTDVRMQLHLQFVLEGKAAGMSRRQVIGAIAKVDSMNYASALYPSPLVAYEYVFDAPGVTTLPQANELIQAKCRQQIGK